MVNIPFRIFFISTSILFVFMFCGIVILLFLTSKRKHRDQIQYLSDLIEEREHIMNFFSEELHDNINQINHLMLIDSREASRYLIEKNYELVSNQLEALQETIYRQINEVRYLSHALNTDSVLKDGLKQALQLLQAGINKLGTPHCNLTMPPEIDKILPPDMAVAIYRIIQEAIQNTIKHAKATKVSISLSIHPNNFELSIQDDGIGFSLPITAGMGLRSIQKRVDFLGGEMQIGNNPTNGIYISIFIQNLMQKITISNSPIL